MPQGIGKLRDKARARFPRLSAIVGRYHTTLSAIAIALFVSFVAFIGYKQDATESTVTRVQGDVNVIKQQSSCSPRKDGKPTNKKKCTENFDTIIHKILTPLQACEFLERGAPLIRIGGKPIPRVECVKETQPISIGESAPKAESDSGDLTADDQSQGASEPHSTDGDTDAGGGRHVGSGAGDGGSGSQPDGEAGSGGGETNPAPESAPEGPGASGGAGRSEESNANEQSEETPASENSRLLPEVVNPLEEIVCHTVVGKVVCE